LKPFARIAQDLDEDERVAALPSDAVRYAWVLTILKGKKLGGRWESRSHWGASVGRQRLRSLDSIVAAGLMVELSSGAVHVPAAKWKDWQADPTGVDRQRRHRSLQKGDADD